MNIGEVLHVSSANSVTRIDEIVDISPVKYDGISEEFVVCEPAQALYNAIVYKDANSGGCKDIILVSSKCDTSLFIDLI